MHIPTFKMLTIRQVWQLIQHGDYAFSVDLKGAYVHFPNVRHHDQFFTISLVKYFISVESFTFWAGWVLLPSLKLYCSFANTRVSVLLSN